MYIVCHVVNSSATITIKLCGVFLLLSFLRQSEHSDEAIVHCNESAWLADRNLRHYPHIFKAHEEKRNLQAGKAGITTKHPCIMRVQNSKRNVLFYANQHMHG